jgi:hypothetical protein
MQPKKSEIFGFCKAVLSYGHEIYLICTTGSIQDDCTCLVVLHATGQQFDRKGSAAAKPVK